MCKTPQWIFTYSNGVVCCVKNRNPIALIFRKIYGTVHEKIAPLIYYKNVIKMHHVCIAITSQQLTLSTSYFHHFILHHFSTVKCILESWTDIRADVPTCDTPWGSKLPYLRVGVIKSLQTRFVGGEVLYLSICSVR